MAISINWATKVIFVPLADLTPVSGSVYSLDLNVFRLTLKDLEDDEVGMAYIRTHNHNPPVIVGGVTLARVVEIINGYTVTFEDGTYAVNLVGANSNVGDVINLNSVSVRSANSAGLIYNASEFNVTDREMLQRLLALNHENAVLDNQTYDAGKRLLSARLRGYNSQANAFAAGVTGLLFEWTVVATYDVQGQNSLFRIDRVT